MMLWILDDNDGSVVSFLRLSLWCFVALVWGDHFYCWQRSSLFILSWLWPCYGGRNLRQGYYDGWWFDLAGFGRNPLSVICDLIVRKSWKLFHWQLLVINGTYENNWQDWDLISAIKGQLCKCLAYLLRDSQSQFLYCCTSLKFTNSLLFIHWLSIFVFYNQTYMSNITSLMANLRFTDEDINSMETLDFAEDHQVEGSEKWIVGRVFAPSAVEHDMLLLVFKAV
ncbi:hypothetical protein V6N13_098874 [Hibiscus sabdariffa]|uniref:Uncharacterized protein n=1 Tax=Hibiscus sabdariffa TaxID=183260 RepID=A0ABR2EF74_9ROSI